MGKSIATVGLGFGDEGKGSWVDYFSSLNGYKYYYKYNGGCQGRHSVNTPYGDFVFSQLSPGIFKGKVILGPNFVFEPFSLINELDALSKLTKKSISYWLKKVYVDKNCVMVSPMHKAYNRIEEEFEGIRGSVGTGVSIAGKYQDNDDIVIYAKDLKLFPDDRFMLSKFTNQRIYFAKLCQSKNLPYKDFTDKEAVEFEINYVADLVKLMQLYNLQIVDTEKEFPNRGQDFLYENSQGILLDRKYGFKPNTTYLDVSCDTIKDLNLTKVGFIRSLYTRHGQGFFPTKNRELKYLLPDKSQEIGKYNGCMEMGFFDCVLFRYALKVTGVDYVCMSHLDYLKSLNRAGLCDAYIYDGDIDEEFCEAFEYWTENDTVYVKNIVKITENIKLYLDKMTAIYDYVYFQRNKIHVILEKYPFEKRVQMYIEEIEKKCNVEIRYISWGKDRNSKGKYRGHMCKKARNQRKQKKIS